MKVKHRLILMALVIISLLSISVVSTSENVSDVIETSDFKEPITVEGNHDGAVPIEDSSKEVLKVKNSKNSKILSVENEIIKDNSSNSFNWTNLYNKTVIDNNSIILGLSSVGKNNTNNSFLVVNFDEVGDDDRASGSYLILALSDILGENKASDSYLVIALSGLLGENKTNDHSYLVFRLSSLGLSNMGNSSFVFDLTDINKNHTINSSYLYRDFDDPLRWDLPSFLDQGASLLGIDLDKYFNENITDLPSFLDNLNLTGTFGANASNLTSFWVI